MLEAAVSAVVPVVGSAEVAIGRHVAPSRRAERTEAWREQASDAADDLDGAVSDQETRILAVEGDATSLRTDVGDIHTWVSDLSARVAVPPRRVTAEVAPYDSGLRSRSGPVEPGKPQTALGLLEARLADHDADPDDALTARFSVQGSCKLRVGKPDEATRLFRHAYARSSEPLRVRQNAAVAHHIEGRNEEAMGLLRELLAEKPDRAAPWTNFILIRESVNGPDQPLDGVPPPKTMASGHSNEGTSARLLLEILLLDGDLGGDPFARAAARFGGPDAEASSHVAVGSAFANLAFDTLPPLQAMKATGTLLRSLIPFDRVHSRMVLSQLGRLTERSDRAEYFRALGAGTSVRDRLARRQRPLRPGLVEMKRVRPWLGGDADRSPCKHAYGTPQRPAERPAEHRHAGLSVRS